jgi:RNA polymerase sigma-70 factor (ECF subfamily)
MTAPQTAAAARFAFAEAGVFHHTLGRDYDPRDSDGLDMSLQGETAPDDPPDGAATIDLLGRAQAGDQDAVETLFSRYMPQLRRWARGRLPAHARDLADTQDLVQDAVMRALQRLHAFEYRHQGALLAYLRQAVNNRILDELRRVQRRPVPAEISDNRPDPSPSPLEYAIGREGLERYEAALQRLRPVDREAIVARLELQQSYDEVALTLGKPNANAARVAVTRALARLLEEMDHER